MSVIQSSDQALGVSSAMSVTAIEWLLDSDPAIRWQVTRDLTDASPELVAAERGRIAREGWGAKLLDLQGEDGQWAGGACFPSQSIYQSVKSQGQPWISTLPTLQLLHDFGIDPHSDRVRRAVAMVRDGCRWENAGQPFFSGEVEPCINGRVVAQGTYFDQNVDAIVARLLVEQLKDGGWNCEVENGSVRSSFATTINVLEGLLAHERATGGFRESIAARHRGEEYLLERKLFRRKSTGEVVNPAWLQFSFPTRWNYDVLRGLFFSVLCKSVPVVAITSNVVRQMVNHSWRNMYPQSYLPICLFSHCGQPSVLSVVSCKKDADTQCHPDKETYAEK